MGALRIDAHQHFWRYSATDYGWISDDMHVLRRDFLPPDLAPLLAANGFDGSMAVQARQTLDETNWLLDLADDYPFILGVVGWVNLCSPRVADDLAALTDRRKLVGIRHIVQGEPDDEFLLRPDFCRGVARLEGFGLAYDILIFPGHLPVAVEFARRFPRQRFVLDHLAKPSIRTGELAGWARDLRDLAALDNVSCKLSGMVTEADWSDWTSAGIEPCLDTAMEMFGAERLMIGSDWPVCTLAADYTRTMTLVIDYVGRLSDSERDLVLGLNAQRFWRLEAP
jgi:L-fuconolactonase